MRILIVAAIALFAAVGVAHATPGDQATFDKGTAAYDAGRYEEAFQIFSDLADNDDVAAMRNVALMLRRGQGVARDPEKAMDMYREAAEDGLATAQYDLAMMLLDGEAGDPDPKEAAMWLTYASESGHALAQFRLGKMYEQGDVVPRDLEIAKRLYRAAAARGHKKAAARLAALGAAEAPETGDGAAAAKDMPQIKPFMFSVPSTPDGETMSRPSSDTMRASMDPKALPEDTAHKTFAGPEEAPSQP